MESRTKVVVGAALLLVSAVIVLYASVAPASTAILGATALASLGLAAGALLLGTSEGRGRAV